MTSEEMNLAIAEMIIPQEKPKSTGNSHRRKQWENKKYWHLCTKWKSCKVGKVKNCELVGKIDRKIVHTLCDDCFGAEFTMGLAGICFDCNSGRFKKYSCNSKDLRDYGNRKVRRYKKEIGNFSCYKKIFDYFYSCD